MDTDNHGKKNTLHDQCLSALSVDRIAWLNSESGNAFPRRFPVDCWSGIPQRSSCRPRIREFQRYRHPVAEDTGVVIEFGEGKNIFPDQVDVCPAFTDVDDKRIGNLPHETAHSVTVVRLSL